MILFPRAPTREIEWYIWNFDGTTTKVSRDLTVHDLNPELRVPLTQVANLIGLPPYNFVDAALPAFNVQMWCCSFNPDEKIVTVEGDHVLWDIHNVLDDIQACEAAFGPVSVLLNAAYEDSHRYRYTGAKFYFEK